ncbi:Rho GTPase-activating protein 27 [Phytophthora cinnamomi]|uniref:Rho GTPase-activating protein 27 n=1 Tax=Phytophthora cinnamomi TaxID=4785 RepID=UPI00355AC0E6|nr:Rho GTPase-activating protein 27 [Phytophthora cinnamomi]
MTITGFTSAVDDGSTSLPTVMAKNTKVLKDSVVDAPERDDESPVLPSDDRHYAPQQEWENSTDATDTNHTNQAIDQDFTQQLIPERQHPAARKIQDQYRCFVRRRIILDQLRFIVAKQRREVRRKSRVKPKKTKDVILDTIAMVPVSEHECRAVETEVTHVDSVNGGLSEHDKQVAQISIKKEIPVGIGMPLAAPLSEDGDSSKEDVLFAARKDSSEYVFDVFDGSNQENGGIQEGATGHVEEVVDKVSAMSTPYLTSECTTSAENLVDQQKRYAALSEKDVSAVNIANATCSCVSCEPLQREEGVLDEQPVLASSGLGVETSTQQPVGVSQISSMLLAELAFADDVEEDKSVAVAALEDPPPHWERYMDSATNKSFYYNPATSETQWTNPEAHAGVNSIDTPTTSHVTVATTDVNGNNKSKASSGLWQEFLDETSGQLYYYNTQTGECSWEVPAAGSDAAEVVVSPQSGATAETAALGASPWIMYIDPASQAPYYVNVETLATTWEQPEDFAVAASESATVVTTEVAGVIEDAYVIAVDDHTGVEI